MTRTDPRGTLWVEAGIGAATAVLTIWLFKDCMERCTGIKLPRDLKTCPPPPAGKTPHCLEYCFILANLLQGIGGLGEALATLATGIAAEVGGANER